MATELTKFQLESQDFVDNTIFKMLHTLLNDFTGNAPEWDIEVIGEVRDVVIKHFLAKGYIHPNQVNMFYPSIEE